MTDKHTSELQKVQVICSTLIHPGIVAVRCVTSPWFAGDSKVHRCAGATSFQGLQTHGFTWV